MIDWSFNLLSRDEQNILCRLSVFVGNFTHAGALAVASSSDDVPPAVANSVDGLISKSFLWTSGHAGTVTYRLLDTTRVYAAEKLGERDEAGRVARRHALHCVQCLRSEMPEAAVFASRLVPRLRSLDTGDIRAAIEWSFSEAGDLAIGTELAALSAPLFVNLSLLRDVRVAIVRGLKLAEVLADRRHELHLLAVLNIFTIRIGDFEGALAVAKRSVRVAEQAGEPTGIVMAEWMLGIGHHLVGDQAAAQRHCERGLEMAAASGEADVHFFGWNHRVGALAALARALWLRGLPERAVKTAHQTVDEALARNHPIDVCIAYIYTIPVFLWVGDLTTAADRTERLIAHAAKYSLATFHAIGHALKGEVLIQSGDIIGGVQLLQDSLAALHAERHHVLWKSFVRALADGLAKAGRFNESIATICNVLAAAEAHGRSFELPDLLRTKGQILLTAAQPDVAAAEAALTESIETAREQSALSWELRAAIPLAQLWSQRGRVTEARSMLKSLLQQFGEGLQTADPMEATRLLEETGPVRG